MAKFSQLLKSSNKKTDNHPQSLNKKVALRRHLLATVPQPRVFDAFAGSGKMYRQVWQEAQAYCGCDLKWYRDSRSVFVAKSERVMRTIDLSAFNIFDFDAYGSPWLHVQILAARRRIAKGETIGLCLTDGCGLKLKMGQAPAALAELCSLSSANVPGINRVHSLLIDLAMTEFCRRTHTRLVAEWVHRRPGKSEMLYLAFVLQGV